MAGVAQGSGGLAGAGQFVGRTLGFVTAAKTNMTTADVTALVKAIETVATITVVGYFESGVTDSMNLIIEGMSFTENDDYYLADGTTPATWYELLDEKAGAGWAVTATAGWTTA